MGHEPSPHLDICPRLRYEADAAQLLGDPKLLANRVDNETSCSADAMMVGNGGAGTKYLPQRTAPSASCEAYEHSLYPHETHHKAQYSPETSHHPFFDTPEAKCLMQK